MNMCMTISYVCLHNGVDKTYTEKVGKLPTNDCSKLRPNFTIQG